MEIPLQAPDRVVEFGALGIYELQPELLDVMPVVGINLEPKGSAEPPGRKQFKAVYSDEISCKAHIVRRVRTDVLRLAIHLPSPVETAIRCSRDRVYSSRGRAGPR